MELKASVLAFVLIHMLHAGIVHCINCQNTWIQFRDSCYLFVHNERLPFYDAEAYCRHRGAHLVHVNDADENSFLKNYLVGHYFGDYHESVWMGLTDVDRDGDWTWRDDGTRAKFFDWYPSEPNGDHLENCAQFRLSRHFRWNDEPCDTDNEPLCEIK